MYHARNMVSQTAQANVEHEQQLSSLTGDFKPKWLEYWFDGLGFCMLSNTNIETSDLTLNRYMECPWTATYRSEDIRCH